MAIDWEKIRNRMEDFVTKAADKAGEFTKEASEKAEQMSRIGRIKLDKIQLKKNKDKVLNKIGQKTFDLLNEGKDVSGNEEIKALIEEIHELDKKLKAKDAKLEKIKTEKAKAGQEEEEPKEEESEAEAKDTEPDKKSEEK
ncbi:MAG: hypothetical protein K9M80_03200 [Candidatus Marinimicrobia bacterium]|nr:hypothetical protein [Candidatus Neomarinimicrobiota bacterium]